ncbi:Hypothetical predicted protein [Podarcis lilfordi]|uniref:Uncharacterized protein n=1 Tax=Podarcis lilfordi TaxID=74358 RepID=A0AA35PEX8_9SAUR|nr:Hypothetical predicted protein [Podarcis lilfordi]
MITQRLQTRDAILSYLTFSFKAAALLHPAPTTGSLHRFALCSNPEMEIVMKPS